MVGPKSTTVGRFQGDDLIPRTFHLYRKFTRARHLWLSHRPDWELIKTHMYTDQLGNYTYAQLLDRFSNNPGRNDLVNDAPYQGGFWHYAYHNWQSQWLFMSQFLQTGPCQISMTLEAILKQFETGLRKEEQEVEGRKATRGQVTRYGRWGLCVGRAHMRVDLWLWCVGFCLLFVLGFLFVGGCFALFSWDEIF